MELVYRQRQYRPPERTREFAKQSTQSMTRYSDPIRLLSSDEYIRDFYDTSDTVVSTDLSAEEFGGRDKGRDISLEFPVEDAAVLPYLPHLEQRLRTCNGLDIPESFNNSLSPNKLSDAEMFDLAIIETVDRAFRVEDKPMSECATANNKLKALVLHEARAMDSWPELARHLKDWNTVARAIDLSVQDQSTFNRAEKKCKYSPNVVEAVALRAVHAAFRNGAPVPDEVVENYKLESRANINQGDLFPEIGRAALLNWMNFILDRLIDGVSFGRADNRKYSLKDLIAAFALAARGDSINGVRDAAYFDYDLAEVPDSSTLSKFIRRMDLGQIYLIFGDIYDNFVLLANELGFFNRSYMYAVDTTWIDIGERRPGTLKKGEDKWGWLLIAIHIVNSDARYTLRSDLLTGSIGNATQRLRANLQRILDTPGVNIEINKILGDSGFYTGDTVRTFRDACGERYIIRAKHKQKGEIAQVWDSVPEGENDTEPNVEFSTVSPNPNLFVYYVPEDADRWEAGTHVAFISDLDPGSYSPEDIFHMYRQRCDIDTSFGELKNQFNIPTESPSPNIRLFLFNIQSIFRNIHVLVNRSLSPDLGVPLDVTYRLILRAITEASFSRISPGQRVDPRPKTELQRSHS